MAWLAILIAAGIGYAVTIGLKGHMEKEPPPGSKMTPEQAHAAACMAAFDKLPTSSDPEKDVRAAAKTAFLYATPGTADMVETLANHCTSLGNVEAGACLRQKANELRAAPMVATAPAPALLPAATTAMPIFPTSGGLGG